jgi:glyoxylase-like metal-dependent hydrolase (beta-lactamase superfamily II)
MELRSSTATSRARASRRVQAIADGVWLVRGGFPRLINVYLVSDGGGVLLFDAGIRSMAKGLATVAQALGGMTRIVLSHSHVDHRGAAPGLGAPVLCHSAERADAEGDAGMSYLDLSKLNPVARRVLPRLWRRWDGGPVRIARMLEEGEEVAGFEVVYLPGHAPGEIALWRRSDRLALASDCFFTINIESGRKGAARMPPAVLTQDTEQARASMLKLAALEPAAAWPGHGDPLLGNVRAALEHAATRS